ncbi:MAG TPA: nucleoside triphosphate pyrophosphatase [Marinagarivorans sp.]
MAPIILASSSRYRKALLEQLNVSAVCIAPHIDEQALAAEHPEATALRLAQLKAQKVAHQTRRSHPGSIIIGSDQVACIQNPNKQNAAEQIHVLGKPGSTDKAIAQLRAQSGKSVMFYTAVCVVHGEASRTAVIPTQVQFRVLSEQEIKRYVAVDNPIDCAGSFKSEGLGSLLFERVSSDDPSALIGLPLITTMAFLRSFGINPLAH